MVNVNDLNVPPPTSGGDVVAGMFREYTSSGGYVGSKTYKATVLTDPKGSLGTCRVQIDGAATAARLHSTAKNIRQGDTVDVIKKGGLWYIVSSDTWHEPPEVSGSMGTKPPAASTVSGSTSISTPNYPAMSDRNQHHGGSTNAWIDLNADRLNTRRDAFITLRDQVAALANRVSQLQSALNTNASRLNQTRDYASNAGQLVEPVVGALRDEGIVR